MGQQIARAKAKIKNDEPMALRGFQRTARKP